MSTIQKQLYTYKVHLRGERMMNSISIGLLGLGTVGSGVVKIIKDHQDKLMHQVGSAVAVKKILVKDVEKPRPVEIDPSTLTTNVDDILNDPEIDVVIEVMGGVEQTRKYFLQAFQNKKHVVTANKDLMALHGAELLQVASENGCDLYFEASVAGGVPIIRSITEGLASDKIIKMMGIVNGTTNFILTKMSEQGAAYEDVLREAQELGFAEADPTSDVEGLDAARKMVILANLGFSMEIALDDVSVQGITKVTEEDIQYGKQLGYTMKLIGIAKQDNDKVEVSVQPTFLSNSHPLASVQNEYNAVYVSGEAVGETMFYGPGAGSLPTASSIVSDLVAIMKNMCSGVNGKSVVAPQFSKKIKEDKEIFSKYFLRLHVSDEKGVFAEITTLFAEHNISFEKILQVPVVKREIAEIVLVTHHASKQDFENILVQLRDLKSVKEIKSAYRVERGSN
jgi:homoserine dehydrogenase